MALAQRLLRSVDSDPAVVAAWEQEIEARVEALDAGLMDTVPAEEVFAEARRILRR